MAPKFVGYSILDFGLPILDLEASRS